MSFVEKTFQSSNPQGTHEIVYNDYGPADGRVVLCVHYLTGNAFYFHALAQALAAQGFRVLAPDLAGRGRSDFLSKGEDYTFPQYIKDIGGLLNHAGVSGKFDWIGASMGGAIGIAVAGQKESPIRSLTLIDIGPVVPGDTIDTIASYVANPPRFDTILDLAAALKISRAQAWGPVEAGYWDFMAEHNARALPEGDVTFAYDPAIADLFTTHGKDDLWEQWGAINCPVLCLHGYKSTVLTKEIARQMKETKPELDLVTLKDCGHVPSMTLPSQIEIVTTWLRETLI